MGLNSGGGFTPSRDEQEETLAIRSDPASTITVLPTDYCIIVTAAKTQAVTVNLEPASQCVGRILQIKSSTDRTEADGGTEITIEPNASETIDAAQPFYNAFRCHQLHHHSSAMRKS